MKEKKDNLIYLLILLMVGGLSVVFVSIMGFLNYRTSALELEEQVVIRIEKDSVSNLETAIGFGKSFENYYGMEDVFVSFKKQMNNTVPFILDRDCELLYCDSEDDGKAEEKVTQFLALRGFENIKGDLAKNDGGIVKKNRTEMVLTPIRQDEEVIGFFGCLYSEHIFDSSFKNVKKTIALLSLIISVLECIALAFFVKMTTGDRWKKRHRRTSDRFAEKMIIIAIMGASIITLSGISLHFFQKDYMDKMENSVQISMQSLEDTIRRVQQQGVDLRMIEDLSQYIEDRISNLTTIRSVRVTDHITEVTRTDEESDILSYVIDVDKGNGKGLYLEAELSTEAMKREMRSIVLVLLSTMIILMIFVFELNNLIELFIAINRKNKTGVDAFSEKQVGIALRFTGFLCSTAEYMCVPYAAMLIRDSGESLFGLSVGMTAALPLTVEGLTQMVAMLCLPRFVKKFNVKATLVVSAILMIVCNISAFSFGGALIIVICRAVAGIAYAGFKQVSNFLITKGYETETGRSDNISQDNAGLLAGATCGAGLGAILSANTGYAMTFVFSACLFVAYLMATFFLLPWKALEKKQSGGESEEKPLHVGNILRMIFSGEILYYVIAIGIPLNIGVMLCVTLIPAICQTNGISSVMLSYCYIANGIAGIYVGPALVSKAKKIFGIPVCIAFTFALAALSIFILRLPPLALMIVITSMILGFLDGFGTPMCTDQFMELNIVKNAVDESTALVFSVVLSYVLLTFAPMIAELLLLPGEGFFSPMMIGAILYAVAAVLVFFFRKKKKGDR
ncbi:MAG: MFS transporter [Lachnospiraceae bacterium]|nr:MFS transporter [Lachnospiraceae bacterium]